MFDGVGDRFGHDQRHGDGSLGSQYAAGPRRDCDFNARMSACGSQLRGQIADEIVKRHGVAAMFLKLALNSADHLQTFGSVAQRAPGSRIGDAALLQRQHRTDHLQVVSNPVLQFLEQQFGSVGQLTAFLRKRLNLLARGQRRRLAACIM